VNANVARHLDEMAASQAGRPALKVPRGRTASGRIDYLTLSFAELLAETNAWCGRLQARGVGRGDRVLILVKPGLPLIALAFALFKLGAVPVVIDPGMGLGSFLSCVRRSQPRALVGTPVAVLLSRLLAWEFGSVEIRVTAGGPTRRIAGDSPAAAVPAQASPTDLAAILFTSGSTGAPKGVRYEHGVFEAQVRTIREAYGIEPGEIDVPLLPIFALFNPALGMTSVIPEMDPRHPARADPGKLVQAILQEGVTSSFGSPTLWGKVAAHCHGRGISLPSLRRVLCAGAPVPAPLWAASRSFLTGGLLHSPYGATEALPVTTISADEARPDSVGGACVGRPVPGVEVMVIAIAEGPLSSVRGVLPAGAAGEIVVRGPVVTREYDAMPGATSEAKIPDGEGGLWHRMGDCGFLDPDGRLWYLGRKAERVVTPLGTYFTEPCEQVFRRHPRAARCALVGLAGEPAIVAETAVAGEGEAEVLAGELRALAGRHEHTAAIRTFLFRAEFPVDVRHNAKIHRLSLARWAATARAFRVP
jgi:acyl-CoA synthetase (AMP-forming)/AMP-acid ligase II